ncbi:DUF4232 domain-containing protein [Streptomyces antimicrobicus]|uniref:DUF4232 domain-containing protein n=1 Tax=Streptomyces antimicrobicus TaxID=2883108 RepID=A0ABS8B3G4_9ACTN|nr:DUF4232 domain-containing protein [Streptomyces antimicrobicus]MCB5179153.1 DUF4232 domain-containing protein [Streptomyces antimicrobicus]
MISMVVRQGTRSGTGRRRRGRGSGRWLPGAALAGALAGLLAGCATEPAPERAPGPTAGAGAPSVPGAGGPDRARAEGCPDGGVRVSEGPGDAAMGLRVASVHLVNCGTGPYVLEGWPDVRLLDEAGAPVRVDIGHGSYGVAGGTRFDEPPRRVELGPGQQASFGLLWRHLVTDADVPAVEGRQLEIRPRPGAPRLSLVLTRPVDLGNTGRMGLGPWSEVPR